MATCFTTASNTLQPRIYVACLAAYNSGILHGAWIEVGQDAWAIWSGIAEMLTASPIPEAEEHAIHDYEGFGGVRIAESTDIETLTQIAAFLAEHGEVGAAVLQHYWGDVGEAREAMEDRYLGSYDSLADYMEEVTAETVSIPQPLRYYIDWQAMARDAEINGDVVAIEQAYVMVHVFAGC